MSQSSSKPTTPHTLPIEAVMPQLLASVCSHPQTILKAAPGAGKSTYFPLQLVKERLVSGKIIMLEPRRLAARNIALYLAHQLGESVGDSVGYRVRGEAKVSRHTRLEIVTEGIMTRMIQSDPELTGVDLVIFDEFHERSIHADTSLALSLEIQEALRDDLKIVVMSATLDHHSLFKLLPDALFIESVGRSFPVDYRYNPIKTNQFLVPKISAQIEHLIENEPGSLLAFLPGVSSIKQVAKNLEHLASRVDIYTLYGQLSFEQQQRAILPSINGRRKIVLATNIAETSLTIEGIRLVVDSGLERVARFDLKTGITRLEQVKIAQSSAEQRAGRAGRLESGICVRLYSEEQLKQQPAVPQPEILHSDLSSLACEMAQWGVVNASDLKWLDTPSVQSLKQARELLVQLKIMDVHCQLTPIGMKAQSLSLMPRVGSMLVRAQQQSSSLFNAAIAAAVILEEPEKNTLDALHSLHRFKQRNHSKTTQMQKRASFLAKQFKQTFELSSVEESVFATALCFAFPDRVAQRRANQAGQFILANGHGAEINPEHRLANSDFIVAIDLMRLNASSSQIFQAVELDISSVMVCEPEQFRFEEVVDWDDKKGRLTAEKQTLFGRLVIERERLPNPTSEKMTQALLNYIRRKGLSVLEWSLAETELLERIRCGVEWLPEQEWPQMSDNALLTDLELWLVPYMNGIKSAKALKTISLQEALMSRLGWPLNKELDKWLPKSWLLPTGTNKKIRYQSGREPVLAVRMQELFGEQTSPCIALGRKNIVLELLSPAQRPLQITQDLAGFWAGAYKEVQKEMKGRYPKHVWPDDPANHIATNKTKRHLSK